MAHQGQLVSLKLQLLPRALLLAIIAMSPARASCVPPCGLPPQPVQDSFVVALVFVILQVVFVLVLVPLPLLILLVSNAGFNVVVAAAVAFLVVLQLDPLALIHGERRIVLQVIVKIAA